MACNEFQERASIFAANRGTKDVEGYCGLSKEELILRQAAWPEGVQVLGGPLGGCCHLRANVGDNSRERQSRHRWREVVRGTPCGEEGEAPVLEAQSPGDTPPPLEAWAALSAFFAQGSEESRLGREVVVGGRVCVCVCVCVCARV